MERCSEWCAPADRMGRARTPSLATTALAGHPGRTGVLLPERGGIGAIDASFEYLKAAGVDGDHLEFGVYKGYTLLHAQQSAHRADLLEMRFFGFDSFEGLPDVQGSDRKAGLSSLDTFAAPDRMWRRS